MTLAGPRHVMPKASRVHPSVLRSPIAEIGWFLCWVVILVAGLWPLTSHVPNQVKWLQSEDGLAFGGNGEVYCRESLADMLGNTARSGDQAFSLELLLRPRVQAHSHVAYILADSRTGSRPGLILLQYGSVLLLQARVRGPNDATLLKLGVDGLVPGQLVHVAVTSGAQGTRLYLNGRRERASDRVVADNELTGPLVLGNSGRPDYPWSGDLLRLAVYDHERSAGEIEHDAGAWRARTLHDESSVALYEFNERSGEWAHPANGHGVLLHVPYNLVILHRSMLVWDPRLDRSGLLDVAENLAGFVPFGFLGAALLARRWPLRSSVAGAILVGFLLSLAIEITQAYLPLRDSSWVDVTMNTVGTAVGAVLLVLMSKARLARKVCFG